MVSKDILMKGALLHDIGKVVLRANHPQKNHSEAGADFLQNFMGSSADEEQILRCVKNHHVSALREARILPDDLSYLVYEADNISAAMDRRVNEGEDKGFAPYMPLKNIFNVFGGSTQQPADGAFRLRGLDLQKGFNYPTDDPISASSNKYQDILDVLNINFKSDLLNMSQNELLRILEDTTSFIPSSTNKEEQADVSLFTHIKITAAVAACMYQYFEAHGINNYKKYCYDETKEFRKENIYLLISGDISGIQDFIYTIPSKGALKSLRGRSVYLELLMENFIDELLTELGLSRTNLIYSGGGHFYLLAGATEDNKSKLQEVGVKCNAWLLEHFGTKLYMALGSVACNAEDLKSSKGQRSIFATVSEKISKDKLNRYHIDELTALFDPASDYNKIVQEGRECSICHTSATELEAYGDAVGSFACPVCNSLFRLGEQVLQENVDFVISPDAPVGSENAVPVFGLKGKLWLYVIDENKLDVFKKRITRIYSKNKAVTGFSIATRLWLADYAAKNSDGSVMTFEQLAKSSCGEETGIKRLGVLRADVDNLGAAFISGFVNKKEHDPNHYATFSRYADLSRYMLMFFKQAVDKICRGEIDQETKKDAFNIFAVAGSRARARKISIVYSGGDDVFLVGAWDELLEAAVDIRRAFRQFTENRLSFSAGLALFNDHSPVRMMADLTGKLEDEAKQQDGKNSIALFGFDTEQQDASKGLACRHVYSWDDFIDKVCLEKIRFLQEHLALQGENNKLPVGTGLLYRLLELMEEDTTGEKINLARFAYTLARMQPKSNSPLMPLFNEFQKQMFIWRRNAADCRQLVTAITLLVYYRRQSYEK